MRGGGAAAGSYEAVVAEHRRWRHQRAKYEAALATARVQALDAAARRDAQHAHILDALRAEHAQAQARVGAAREKQTVLGRAMSELRGRIARAETEASVAEADRVGREREQSRREEEEARGHRRLRARLHELGRLGEHRCGSGSTSARIGMRDDTDDRAEEPRQQPTQQTLADYSCY